MAGKLTTRGDCKTAREPVSRRRRCATRVTARVARLTQATFLGTALVGQPAIGFDYFQPLPKSVPVPKDNPLTADKIELGKQLFFDARLSRAGTHSCNSCHNLAGGAEDGRATSPGANGQRTRRNAPTLWNIGFQTVLYWDGRARSLEDQFADHVADPTISGFQAGADYVARLRAIPGYGTAFRKALNSEITLQAAAYAVAAFERTLLTPNSRHDRLLRGEKNALTAQELRGKELFRTVECLSCHFGVNYAGPAPGPALGMGDGFYELFPNHPGTEYDASHGIADDLGVFEFDGDPGHKRLWRVPPLRNIALTAPYFHNGSARTLDEAVRIMAKTQLRKDLSAQEAADIVAFLKTLTGQRPKLTLPALPDGGGVAVLP